MEIGQQHINRLEPIAGRDEDRGLAGEGRRSSHLAAAADSRSRKLVVPAAMIRPPVARAWFSASAVAPLTSPHSACILWSGRILGLDRQETCPRRHAASRVQGDAARFERGHEPRREMQARGRRRDRAGLLANMV